MFFLTVICEKGGGAGPCPKTTTIFLDFSCSKERLMRYNVALLNKKESLASKKTRGCQLYKDGSIVPTILQKKKQQKTIR